MLCVIQNNGLVLGFYVNSDNPNNGHSMSLSRFNRHELCRVRLAYLFTDGRLVLTKPQTLHQGNSDKENPEGDGVQDDQQEEEEAGAHESSGVAGMRPFNPDLKERFKQLEKQSADLVAGKMKLATSFQGVKQRPADPPKYAGGNKDVINDRLAMMVQWLGSGMCVPEQRVGLAQTFLTGGATSLWRAKSAVLQAQGFDIQD
jgi:hypothetical protein